MSARRNFLFLQGPIGPFFKMLAESLVGRGHAVQKVNFSGGDAAFFPDGVSFTGKVEEWPSFLLKICARQSVTDIVLFGDRRAYHELAIEVISEGFPGMRVWVFEEGYFRPNWVTLDHWGVNARSAFPASRAELMDTAGRGGELREPGAVTIQPWFREFAPVAARYYAMQAAMRSTFPHFEYHRVATPGAELAGWMKSWGSRLAFDPDPAERQRFERRPAGRHFVFALQLEGDYQIRRYSPFERNQEVIEHVLQSFAKNRRPSDTLVCKPHPYDYEWLRWQGIVKSRARALGIEQSVMVITRCAPTEILTGCAGFLTINSTFALKAMELGIPVKALGQAFWNYAPLAHEGSLESFWHAPTPGSGELFGVFKRHLMARTQYNGGFYSRQGRELCLGEVLPVLESGEQEAERLSREPLRRLRERRQERLQASSLTPLRKKKIDLQL